VSAAAHRQDRVCFTRNCNNAGYILSVGRADDSGWAAVNPAVEYRAGLIIFSIIWCEDCALDGGAELGDQNVLRHDIFFF
jgi:hypothetical protein